MSLVTVNRIKLLPALHALGTTTLNDHELA